MENIRSRALEDLESFLPRAGKDYERLRNYDFGPKDRSNISNLSKYLSRGIIKEEEVLASVLKVHSARAAEKFIQEVFWRSYWKGWLEMRPKVWSDFLQDVSDLSKEWKNEGDYLAATEGRTGIPCYDDWLKELVDLGFLHNHSRMWFASIWIFTLNLPWQLGAALFQKYLVDFDAASNTLSWRWVAGIQTAGKHYIARAENINKFTEGRYNPVGLLNENPRPIVEKGDYQRSAYPSCGNLAESVSGVLLLFEENLMLPEQLLDFGFDKLIIIRNSDFKGEAEKFSRACTESIKVTLSETKDVLVEVQGFENDFDQKNSYLSSYLFQGPAKDYLSESSMLEKTTQFRNSWDEKYHPSAKAGYFKFRKAWQKELSGS